MVEGNIMLDALVRFTTSFVLNGWTYYFLIAGIIIWIVSKIVEKWENKYRRKNNEKNIRH